MRPCTCELNHERRRIVLTGGPGAGKTAVLELVHLTFCEHVHVLPEAAGIVYGGGFPRGEDPELRRASQRAIFHIERELETAGDIGSPPVVLCDRGTVDGGAYWPGPDQLWPAVGTTLADELARYDCVIHLRVPRGAVDRGNPLRVESPKQAHVIDDRIASLWSAHPRRFTVEPEEDFLVKASRALAILRDEVPECCRPRALVLA